MESINLTIAVSESIGSVSAIAFIPGHAKAMIVLAHGAGAGMKHAFMETLCTKLSEVGIATLRYNFPFLENSKKRPDPPQIAEKTVAAALNKARELYPKLPVFAAGKSFGGRMSSQLLSKSPLDFVKGIVFYGFPLHAAGDPSVTRAGHLYDVHIPMLFLQGTKDALADLSLLGPITEKIPTARLVTLEGADHSFKAGKKDTISELVTKTEEWIGGILRN